MKREVVQDFLNLPGIAGLALMDGRSRPYFYGIDRSLNFQQKEALAQGIQQVIDTTPADFEFFQFQFGSRQVYIYKLAHGIILLVLTVERLIDATYLQLVEQLKLELQQDLVNAIATFRLLAGNTTLSGQQYWKQGTDTASPAVATQSSDPPVKPVPTPSPAASAPLPASTQPIATAPPPFSVPLAPAVPQTAGTAVLLKDALAAMNDLSRYATQYLGPMVVTNYWKTSRPSVEWLNIFQVERSAQIVCPDQTGSEQLALTQEQHQWLREWVAAFINRCAKVIRDFPKTVRQNALDDRQKFLLLADSQ